MTVDTILLIVVTILVLAVFIIELVQVIIRRKRPTIGPITLVLLPLILLFAVFLTYRASELESADWAQIILMIALVAVTAFATLSATRQANASVKMAEEMKEQRVMASRPVIIQKAVIVDETELATEAYCDWFSYFEVYNTGNGPAIEVEISLLNKEKTPIHSQRKTFLRAGEPPIEFSPSELASLEKSTFYLVCEYQSILSQGTRKTWYQTWLPFETVEASKEGKIYVKPGELEFYEVSEKERIDAFGSRSKPK